MPRPKGGYYLKDGTRVPSVTTVIGRFKDSTGLLHWAFQQGKNGAEHLYEESGKAADVGTLAHAMVEAEIKGLKEVKTTTDDPILIAKARQAFGMYREWARQTRVHIVTTEMDLISEQFRYGGTPDAIGQIGDQLCLLDWKTSNAVYVDHLIQVAAYAHLWNEQYPQKPIDGGYHILRFSKDFPDFAHRHYQDLEDAWEQFTLMRRAYDIDKVLKKRVG